MMSPYLLDEPIMAVHIKHPSIFENILNREFKAYDKLKYDSDLFCILDLCDRLYKLINALLIKLKAAHPIFNQFHRSINT